MWSSKQKAHTILAKVMTKFPSINLRRSGPITQSETQYTEKYILAKYPKFEFLGIFIREKRGLSALQGLHLRWSGPITPTERQRVEQYVLEKYPPYLSSVGGKIDFSALCIKEDSSAVASPDTPHSLGMPSPGAPKPNRYSPTLFFGKKLPDLDRTQLDNSRLLDILAKKTSFPGCFVSIPEIQAQNKVLKHCGLTDDDYFVLFVANYKEAMGLVGESYPFFRGNFYMTLMADKNDPIRGYASLKESKVILAPETWLDLRIKGSQLSQYLRRKCWHSPKGLFSYPVTVNGAGYKIHWISEARRYSWHVLVDVTSFSMGKDKLNLGSYRPDFVLCSLNNADAQCQPSNITCLLIRKKSFSTTTAAPTEYA